MNALFTSRRDDWRTPKRIWDELNQEFQFDWDVCASDENALLPNYYTECLDIEWQGSRNYMNPPYGRNIGKFMGKANEQWAKGKLVVCLVPARTDTLWFHDYAIHHEIRFIKGRLKFDDGKNSAPFPSCVVVMK